MLSSVRLAAPFSTINSAVHNVYIAIGSNVEDRALALHDAFTKLQTVGTIKSTSFLYESLPMYHTEQPKFLNAAVHLETALPPDSLLVHLKSIETELGRKTTFRNGPRVVDLDILFYDDQQIQTDSLEIPHPRIAERSFVLKPLYDIQPNLLHPATGLTVKQMLDKLPKSSITEEMVKVIPCVLYQSNEDRSNSSIEREQQQISTSLLYLNKTTPCIFGVLNVTPDRYINPITLNRL